MIEFMKGNILRADAEALVNTVNCVGFMGRGIAAQFKRTFPKNSMPTETDAMHTRHWSVSRPCFIRGMARWWTLT